jgi:hypothetical protein
MESSGSTAAVAAVAAVCTAAEKGQAAAVSTFIESMYVLVQ